MTSDLNPAVAYDDGANRSPVSLRRELPTGSYAVSSIFGPTIQGEGPYAGQPAIFIRLAGCNRGDKTSPAGCAWCDADFRWTKATRLSVSEIVACVDRCNPDDRWKMLVVITGGEPLLHDCIPLVDELIEQGYHVQFETNGDYLYDDLADQVMRDWNRVKQPVSFVVSPKIGNRNRGYSELNHNWFNLLHSHTPVWLKTLVSADLASAYSKPHPAVEGQRLSGGIWPLDRIYLSPLAIYRQPLPEGHIVNFLTDTEYVDREATAANYAHAARMAIRYGVKLSLQTHQLISLP